MAQNTQGVEPTTAAESAAVGGVGCSRSGSARPLPRGWPAPAGRPADGPAEVRAAVSVGARAQSRVIDEATLQAVAEITGGQYYKAESADQLQEALGDLHPAR